MVKWSGKITTYSAFLFNWMAHVFRSHFQMVSSINSCHSYKWYRVWGVFSLFSRLFPSFPFPCRPPPRSGPSNPAKEFGGALTATPSGGQRHLQPPDTFPGAQPPTHFSCIKSTGNVCGGCICHHISVKRNLKVEQIWLFLNVLRVTEQSLIKFYVVIFYSLLRVGVF